MRRWVSLWSRRSRLWVPPLLFVLINLLLLGGHRWILLVRVTAQEQSLNSAEERLESLRTAREGFELSLDRAEVTRRLIDEIRGQEFETQSRRLTRMMGDIKALTRRANLSGPDNIAYSGDVLEEVGLLRKEIRFSVIGSYENLRRLINFIELSESFLILEEVRVQESDGGTLKIGVTLSTLFELEETSL